MIDLEELQEKVILIAVSTGEEDGSNASLDELEELAATAGAVTVGRVIQNRERIHPGTYLGKGKIDEVRDLVWELHATGVICDDELSPAQLRNLEDSLDTKVMDRTMVTGHLCIQGQHAGRQDPGGTGPVKIQGRAPGRHAQLPVTPGRRHRHQGAG